MMKLINLTWHVGGRPVHPSSSQLSHSQLLRQGADNPSLSLSQKISMIMYVKMGGNGNLASQTVYINTIRSHIPRHFIFFFKRGLWSYKEHCSGWCVQSSSGNPKQD